MQKALLVTQEEAEDYILKMYKQVLPMTLKQIKRKTRMMMALIS
jgi:hypothetical protein